MTEKTVIDNLVDGLKSGVNNPDSEGLNLEELVSKFNSLKPSEPSRGEEVIGSLQEDELYWYVMAHSCSESLEDVQAELGGSTMIAMGNTIKSKSNDIRKVKEAMEKHSDNFCELYKLERQLAYYQNTLYHSICQRLGHWDWTLGVRSKQRIVKVERKW